MLPEDFDTRLRNAQDDVYKPDYVATFQGLLVSIIVAALALVLVWMITA